MSQNSIIIANGTGVAVRTAFNNALDSLSCDFSGTSEPITTWANMWWADTTNNILKRRNLTNTAWISFMDLTTGDILTKAAVLNQPYIQAREEYSNGTSGQDAYALQWNRRFLNVLIHNVGEIAVFTSSNTINIPAGTYYCQAQGCTWQSGGSRLRVQDVTSNSTLLIGLSLQKASDDNHTEPAVLSGRFTLPAAANIQLQHWVGRNRSNGFGLPAGTDDVEIYSILELWKLG